LNFDWLIVQQNVNHNWTLLENEYCLIICSNNAVIDDLSIWLFIEQAYIIADMILSFDVYSSDICVTVNSTDDEDLHCSDYSDFEAFFKVIFFKLIMSSWVLEFKSSTQLEKCWVELKFFWKSVESSWEAWFDNSTQKLDSTQQDIK